MYMHVYYMCMQHLFYAYMLVFRERRCMYYLAILFLVFFFRNIIFFIQIHFTIGTFANVSSKYCTPCPPDTTTAGIASTSIEACTLCEGNMCHHGQCSVHMPYFRVACDCDPGYRSWDNCLVPWLPLVGTFFGAIFVAIMVWILRRLYVKLRYEHQVSSLRERLLEEQQKEVDALRQVWNIDYADIIFELRLDEGAFGEVPMSTSLHRWSILGGICVRLN